MKRCAIFRLLTILIKEIFLLLGAPLLMKYCTVPWRVDCVASTASTCRLLNRMEVLNSTTSGRDKKETSFRYSKCMSPAFILMEALDTSRSANLKCQMPRKAIPAKFKCCLVSGNAEIRYVQWLIFSARQRASAASEYCIEWVPPYAE